MARIYSKPDRVIATQLEDTIRRHETIQVCQLVHKDGADRPVRAGIHPREFDGRGRFGICDVPGVHLGIPSGVAIGAHLLDKLVNHWALAHPDAPP
mgnify:CR=1 FL=1